MNAMILLLASATLGVDVGWQPLAGGGFEYIIQISPDDLEALKGGQDIVSEIPPELVGVKRYRITVGTGPVPRIGTPPEVASGQYQPDAAATTTQPGAAQADAVHDPFATSGYGSQSTNNQTTTNNPPVDPANNGAANGDRYASSANVGDTQTQGGGYSLLNDIRNRVQGDAPANAADGNSATDKTAGQPNASGTTGVPQMGDNPFRDERYANNPQYGEGARYSAGGAADPSAPSGNPTGGEQQVTEFPLDLPAGEYIMPIGETQAAPTASQPATNQPTSQGTDRYPNRYEDYSSRNFGQGNFGGASDSTNDGTQENPSFGDTPTNDQADQSDDPFERIRRANDSTASNSTASNSQDTPPPALHADDNATRLANYRSDEAGPSSSSSKNSSKPATEEAGKPGWMWTLLVLTMFASAGANAWQALLLRDSRRKYADLLERYQDGDEEEEYEEDDVHYEAA